jgi:hypothetical protein
MQRNSPRQGSSQPAVNENHRFIAFPGGRKSAIYFGCVQSSATWHPSFVGGKSLFSKYQARPSPEGIIPSRPPRRLLRVIIAIHRDNDVSVHSVVKGSLMERADESAPRAALVMSMNARSAAGTRR